MRELDKAMVLVVLFLILPIAGVAQDITEQQITGEWVFNYETSLGFMDESAKHHYENMNANMQAEVQQAYQNRKLIFGVGGDFSQELANGRNAEGSWVLGKGNIINISSPTGYVISFRIKLIDESSLILIPIKSDQQTVNMLFSKWYLVKG